MKKFQNVPLWLRGVSILVLTFGVALGSYFYFSQKQTAHLDIYKELAIVADLKVNQITSWREERVADANIIKANPLIREGWESNELNLDADSIVYLQSVRIEKNYCNILLVDPATLEAIDIDGNLVELHPPARRIVDDVLKGDQVLFTDMHMGACDDKPHVDLAIPYFDIGNGSSRVLLLQIGTEEFLYPLLQTWPWDSATGETLLIHQVGDEVLFLNDLRHAEDAALQLRIPLTEEDVPAIMAVNGIVGPVAGVDYRGVPVFAVIQPVPETDWYMISKIDQKEGDQQWLLRTNAIIAAVVLLMISIIAGAVIFWQRREKIHVINELMAAKVLKESEDRFRSYVENSPNGIFIVDRKGNYVEVNPTAAKLTGYSQEELLGMNISEIVAPEERAASGLRFKKLTQIGKMSSESVYITKSGERRHWTLQAVKLSEDRFLGFTTDITERVNSEKALTASQEKYDLAMDVTEEGIWEWYIDTDEVIWSSKWERMFGEENQRHSFSSWADRIHPDDKDETNTALQKHLSEKSPMWQSQYRIKTTNGSWMWVLGKGRVINRDQEGKPLYMVGTISDITEIKLLEEMLSFRQRQFERVLDLLPVGVWLADKTGKLISSNPMGPKIWGAEPHVGMDEYGVFSARKYPSGEPIAPEDWALAHTIREGITVENELLEIDAFDGVKRIIENFTAPLLDSVGNVEGAIVVNHDITDLKKAEQAVQELNADLERRVIERTEQLETANEEMEAFVYSVSHDLRAPLRAIDGYSHFLRDQYDDLIDEEGLRYFQTISENISRMNNLIDGLLNLSKINRTELEYQNVDSAKMVNNILENLQRQYGVQENEFLVHELPSVNGDEVLLYQVWHNLLENAVKYSRKVEHPLITVGVQVDEEFTAFSVQDNGVGFDNQYVGNLFGVFQRLHSVKEYDGVGIGLAIVERIINRHDGKVWAEGEEGIGATFYFSLPK